MSTLASCKPIRTYFTKYMIRAIMQQAHSLLPSTLQSTALFADGLRTDDRLRTDNRPKKKLETTWWVWPPPAPFPMLCLCSPPLPLPMLLVLQSSHSGDDRATLVWGVGPTDFQQHWLGLRARRLSSTWHISLCLYCSDQCCRNFKFFFLWGG